MSGKRLENWRSEIRIPAGAFIHMKNLKLLLSVFLIAFLLNLLWENLHSLLYLWNILPLKNDVYFYVYKILKASVIDAFLIVFIFLLNSLYRKNFNWVKEVKRGDYLLFLFLGLIFAVIIEIKAKILNLWSYSESMPLVFGIGLTPLIQLAVTGAITLKIVNALKN